MTVKCFAYAALSFAMSVFKVRQRSAAQHKKPPFPRLHGRVAQQAAVAVRPSLTRHTCTPPPCGRDGLSAGGPA